ncbi:DNA polymerase III subunit delta' [Clostridium cellulovorans]|uniref:DNA polymerase III subunit delta' n=1 Tax=Clostridium cellulovorans (strain ATCC 35296 / DSM 3052 / OCM 3 / 743B) TaxID=573061 RepID=D9SNL9_CLOC7|nr:DNA polymerase III subunit delta' [Clostridium cellulovorans]ADL49890.1 DNA polymerase III delta [Clostridium cellulovorans 743B]
MEFSNIIGNEEVKKQFVKNLEAKTFAHAHIIAGEDGSGKSLMAKSAAIKILSKSIYQNYADIIEFKTSKASIGVDDIRVLIEETNKKPFEGDKKVIIIYNAEKITVQGQNAFLKTIEEPPKGVFIFLLCENLEKILDTIKSRCQIHRLRRLSYEEMKLFLSKNYKNIKAEEMKPLIAFSDGIPGRVEKYFTDDAFRNIRNITMEILISITGKEVYELLKYEEQLMKYKNYWQDVLSSFISYVRDALIYKETGDEQYIINIDKIDEIKIITDSFSYNKLNKIIDTISYVKDNMQSNVNPSVTFDMMLLKFQEV